MKRRLYLIRHAQAEDLGNSRLFRDFDRALTSKGLIQSARMGEWLKNNGHLPSKLISSPAARALKTAEVMAERFKNSTDQIAIQEDLYGGGPKAYLKALNTQENETDAIAIFGHNPDITFFAEYLTRDDILGSMEKATVICLEVEDLSWEGISAKSMHLVFRKSVRELDEE